jgi:hypothetical protein
LKTYADLRESSLCFGFDQGTGRLSDGILEDATHRSIRAALNEFKAGKLPATMDARQITERAVRIARRNAMPAASFEPDHIGVTSNEMDKAVEAANRVAFDLRRASVADVEAFGEVYAAEVRQLAEEHANDDRSASRLITFGANHTPLRMDDIFNRETRDLSNRFDPEAIRVELGGSREVTNALYDRIRVRRGEHAHTDRLQYAEPLMR